MTEIYEKVETDDQDVRCSISGNYMRESSRPTMDWENWVTYLHCLAHIRGNSFVPSNGPLAGHVVSAVGFYNDLGEEE